MTAVVEQPLIRSGNVAELLAAAAPGVNQWFRQAVAPVLVNRQASPDAMFWLADALDDELAQFVELTAPHAALVRRQVASLRSLANIAREHGTQLVTRWEMEA